jgi:hypothetical protein
VRRDNDRIDDLVRRLNPVDAEQATSALDDRAKSAFAQEIISRPALTEPRTEEVFTRRRRTPSRMTRPVLAAIAILVFATTGLTIILPPGGAPPAIAGWEPTPASAPADLLANVEAECTPPETAGASEQLLAFMNSDPQLAAIDVRGNAASAVFADDTQYLICNLVEEDESWAFSASQHDTFVPADGQAITADAQQQWTYGETSITTLVGRTSQDVDHVRVERSDGMQIDATTRNDIFIAWWPNAHTFTTADAFGTDGEMIGSADDAPPAGGFVNEF